MTDETKQIKTPEAKASDGNIKDSEEKLYSQKELEKIVEQRLIRERKNTESFRDIREIIAELKRRGDIEAGSNAQIASKLGSLLEAAQNKTPEEQSEEVPPVAAPDSDKKTSEPTLTAEVPRSLPEEEKGTNEFFEFIEKFGEEKLKKLMNDRTFSAFSIGKSGSLASIYENYIDFLSALSDSNDARKYRAAEAGLASTGFSKKASGAVDYGSALTENQKSLARSAGMSYKQYSELLSQIPNKKLKK